MKKMNWNLAIPLCLLSLSAGSVQAAYKVLDGGVADGGTLVGQITLDGVAPEPEMLIADEDTEACGGDRPAQNLLVDSAGGVQNVILSIEGVDSGKPWGFSEEFYYDQKNCTFVPRVLLIQPGNAGVVHNSDSVGHNFHTISKGTFNTNKKINADSEMAVPKNKIRRPGLVRVKCDIHSWMKGWWLVAANPYASVTNENGKFSIADIPPGSYTVKIWHETLGESEQSVVVEANKDTELNISLGL